MRNRSPQLIHSLAGGVISAFLYFLSAMLFYVGFRLPGALGWLGLFMSGPGLLGASLLWLDRVLDRPGIRLIGE